MRRPTVAALLFLRGRDADARLRAIEAQRARVRPVLGALAARLRDTRGWRRCAFRTQSDYTRERLGVGARVVQEWARVWQALGELPRLREAVLSGEVSWSVARRLVRVATPETDAACVETVRGRTVRAVDALVAAVRKAEREEEAEAAARAAAGADPARPAGAVGGAAGAHADEDEEAEERVRFRMACPRAVGAKWNAAVELARRWKGDELPVGACAELIAAEVTSALPPEPEAAREETGNGNENGNKRGRGNGKSSGAHVGNEGEGGSGSGDEEANGLGARAGSSNGSENEAGARIGSERNGVSRRGSATGAARPWTGSVRSLGTPARPAAPTDPEPGLRAAAYPHLPWRPLKPRLPAETELELDRLTEGLEECGAHELDRRLRLAVGFAQALDAELGRVLRQVLDRRLYEEVGFRTFEDFVRERLDTAPRTARRLVQLARAEHRAPAVAEAFRQGEVTACQADVLLGVVERGGPRAPRPDGTLLSQLDGLARLQDLLRSGEMEGCGRDGRGVGEERENGGGRKARAGWEDKQDGETTNNVGGGRRARIDGEDGEVGVSGDAGDGHRGRVGGEAERGSGPHQDSAVTDGGDASVRSESTTELEARWLAQARRMTLRRLELEANAEPPTAVVFVGSAEEVAFFRSVLDRVHRRLVRHQLRSRARSQGWAPSRSPGEGQGGSQGGDRSRSQSPSQAGTGTELPIWAALEAMLEHVIVHWMREECAAARQKPRDYLDFNRDGNRCTMPGCTARAMLERHHIWYRSDRGPDVAWNRTSLCWFHHHAVVHQQRARIAGRAPDRLLFELGTRPDGPPLVRYRSGDVAL